MVFLELRPEPAFCSRFMTGMALKNWFLFSGSYLVVRDTSGLSLRLGRASRGEAGNPGSLSSCHRDIGIPFNF